jgi:hypothetical protein
MKAGIFSFSWQHVDERVFAAQRRVFEHFHCSLFQHRIHGLPHGEWIDFVMQRFSNFDVLLFVDSDAFPANKLALDEALDKASQGILYGNAQVSHHIDPTRLFVGPSWCAVSRKSWIAAGSPSARADKLNDVAQRWTDQMSSHGIQIETLKPKSCIKPLWKLPDGSFYGIGTLFESATGAQNFHMFGVSGDTYQDSQYPADLRLRLLEEQADRICSTR